MRQLNFWRILISEGHNINVYFYDFKFFTMVSKDDRNLICEIHLFYHRGILTDNPFLRAFKISHIFRRDSNEVSDYAKGGQDTQSRMSNYLKNFTSLNVNFEPFLSFL